MANTWFPHPYNYYKPYYNLLLPYLRLTVTLYMLENDKNHLFYGHFLAFFGFSDGPFHANTPLLAPDHILHLPPTPSIEVRQCGPICTASGPLFPPMSMFPKIHITWPWAHLHNTSTPHIPHLQCVDSGEKKKSSDLQLQTSA